MAAVIVAAAVAAVFSWGVGESGISQFRPAISDLNMMGHAYRGESPQSRELAMLKEASCLLGSFGALLGLGVGLVAGWLEAGHQRAIFAGAVGFLAGAIAGAVPVWLVIPAYNRAEELTSGDLERSLVMHYALWTALGAASGLALGVGLGDWKKLGAAILGGAVGVVIGASAYDLLGSWAFPLSETGKPFAATPAPRLMAMLFLAVSAASGACLAVSLGPKRRGSRPAAAAS
jgi:hypothetical protein